MLGEPHALTSEQRLGQVETATFATSQRVLAILRPADRDEVRECLRIANRHGLPLYPVSGGRNWGLGSRVPPRDGSALLDLSRLDRILGYDERMGTLTVEPGVTFRQAYMFLREQGSSLALPVTGGPSGGSIVGNTVERGDPVGPFGERLDHVCALEVVLATGEVVHTGFSRYEGARAADLHRWGVGPATSGLFTQSNLGIVTRLTLWLEPTPVFHEGFSCSIPDGATLVRFLDTARELVRDGVLRPHALGIWNSYKFLAGRGRFPWSMTGGETPLDLGRLKGAEPWLAAGSVSASDDAIGRAMLAVVRERLEGVGLRLVFGSNGEGECAPPGVPSDRNMCSTYWRKRTPMPSDPNPDRDGCGVLWVCAALPFDGEETREVINVVERLIKNAGFEPNLGLISPSARCLYLYPSLMYDRDVPGEDERARACHDSILDWLVPRGYLPYRLGIQSMDALPPPREGYGAFMAALKTALDPHDILAPGRYDFRSHWPPDADPRYAGPSPRVGGGNA